MSSDTEQQLGQRAIIIGAGMGGLMAAGVLARYFPVSHRKLLKTGPSCRALAWNFMSATGWAGSQNAILGYPAYS